MKKAQEEKISRAKAKLLVDYPYFGTLASRLKLSVNDNIETFKSDGKTVEYNNSYLEDLEFNELEFILANGAMHATLAHENRKQNRSGWLWQMATDMAINDMLVQNGMTLPYGAQYRKRFIGMYAEEIYAQLKDDILRDDLEYESEDKDDILNNDKENNEQILQQIQEQILEEQLLFEESVSLLENSMQDGEVPKSIDRFFKLTGSGKIDWRDELRIAIDYYYKDNYTFIPPNKKFLSQNIYLPSSSSNRLKLVVAIDSSGSVEEELLNEFLSELNFLMLSMPNYQIELLICDDKIHTHKTFYSGESLDVNLKGGGGTDFRPVFKFIEDEFYDINLLLYFSDLEGIFPYEIPNYEVKWISPRIKEVPFGDVIIL